MERIRSINSGLTILGCIPSSYWKLISSRFIEELLPLLHPHRKSIFEMLLKITVECKEVWRFSWIKLLPFCTQQDDLITIKVCCDIPFVKPEENFNFGMKLFWKSERLEKDSWKLISVHIISFYFSQKVFRSKHLFEPIFAHQIVLIFFIYKNVKIMVSINGKYEILSTLYFHFWQCQYNIT